MGILREDYMKTSTNIGATILCAVAASDEY